MNRLRALLFDVDGTLADTEGQGHRVAFNRAFADAGLDWYWDEPLYRELLAVTGGKERMRHYIDRYRPDFTAPEGGLTAFLAELHQAKNRHYAELLAQGAVPLRPGVERLLRQAREAGVTLAIATTTSPENVTALLENTLGAESLGWFAEIGAGDVVPAKKPAPDIYFYVLERLGLEADQTLALEDSANGVRAAVAAGVPTLVTANDYTREDDFTGALEVVDQLGEPGSPARRLGDGGELGVLGLEEIERLWARR